MMLGDISRKLVLDLHTSVLIARGGRSNSRFVGVKLDKNARGVGVHLSALSTRIGRQVPLIAAILRNEELIIPRGDDRLLAGDEIYFITEEHRLLDSLAVFDNDESSSTSDLADT